MTDVFVALAIGFVAGVLVGRILGRPSNEQGTRTFRPTKRQRRILETLTPDPVVPSIQELVVAEAKEVGVDATPGADGVPLHIRLKAWKRDRDGVGPCDDGRLRFRVRESVEPGRAQVGDVTLVCEPDEAD